MPLKTEPSGDIEAEDELRNGMSQALSILLRVFTSFGVSGLVNDEGEVTEGVARSLVEAARRSAPINVVG